MTLTLAILAVAGPTRAQPRRTPSQPVFLYEYDVKVVCGEQPDRDDLRLALGFYATTVNLWNPHPAQVEAELRLALAIPPEGMAAGDAVDLDPVMLPPRRALAVDCRAIRALYFGYGFPAPVIDGMLSIRSLQPLEVTAVWTTASLARHGGAGKLSSLDVDRIAPHLVEADLRDPAWDSDADPGQRLCAALRRTSTIVTGRVEAITYTFDEAPDEGPREVVRFGEVEVLAGNGGVVGGPLLLRMRRGLFPDGRFLMVSETPVFSPGGRYLLLLPNHTWLVEPVGTATTFRIESLADRELLVDQEGLAVTDVLGGRLADPVSTPERIVRVAELVVDDPDAIEAALEPEEYLDALLEMAAGCEGPVIAGPYAAFPLVPPSVFAAGGGP